MINEAMRAGVLTAPKKIELKKLRKPTPGCGDVLVSVKTCGICTTDRRMYSGQSEVPYPAILGHEVAGVVEKLGENVVTDINEGDHVVIGHCGCGECYYCRRGYPNLCQNFFRMSKKLDSGEYLLAGGFADYLLSPSGRIYKIPPDLKFEEASLAEPLSCVLHSVQRANLTFGENVAIIGAGPMGLLHLLVTKKLGSTVVVSESDEKRRGLAEKLGADFTLDPSERDAPTSVQERTDGRGADAVFVAVGGKGAAEQGIAMAGKRGRVVFYGSTHPSTMISVSSEIHYDEKCLTGSSNATPEEFREAVALLSSRAIDVGPLISKVIRLDDIKAGFETRPKGDIQRIIVKT